MRRLAVVLAAGVVGGLGAAAHAQTPRIDLIQPLPGSLVVTFTDLSYDGYGVGYDQIPFPATTFSWSREQGRVSYPTSQNPFLRISGNGTFAVDSIGVRRNLLTGAVTQMPSLGLNSFQFGGMSHDGNVIVGDNVEGDSSRIAFRWTPETGTVAIPNEFGSFNRYTYAVSGDGRTVGGIQDGFGNLAGGWVWNESAGLTYPVGPRGDRGWITAINGDGRIWAGAGLVASPDGIGTVAGMVRWVDGVGEEIPMLGSYIRGMTTGMSDDGSIILGRLSDPSFPGAQPYRGLIWKAGLGSFYIEEYLRMMGVALPENNFITDPVISGDGLTMAGTIVSYGTGLPNGYGIVVTLPTPGGIGVLALAPIATRRRRGTRSPVPCR